LLWVKNDKADELLHPPGVWKVSYQPGSLRAVAQFAVNELIHERRSDGSAYQILLKSDVSRLAVSRGWRSAVISAYTSGLRLGRASIIVTAPGKPDEMDYIERFQSDETPVTAKPQ
jgi:hypothetical protein